MGMEDYGPIHKWADEHGVEKHIELLERSPSWKFYLGHIRALISFTRKKNIDIVYSHTQPANIISVFAQYFSPSRFIICRHHSDYIMNGENKNAQRFDSIINKLGSSFIVPSSAVLRQMVEREHVDSRKIRLIPYAYNFSEFPKVDKDSVKRIRNEHSAKLLLVTVSRFIPCKRYELLIHVIAQLTADRPDVKLLILGDGPLEEQLKNQVNEARLNDKIIFIGYTSKVMDYLDAADVVVHTSDSEASNSVIKEAGLLGKRIIACHEVGDFDDYIIDRQSGFLISKNNTETELLDILKNMYDDPELHLEFGRSLKESVLENFSYENIIPLYSEITEAS